jgi:hypothetical protein
MKVVLNDVLYDLYKEYCRLKGYPLPKTPLDQWIDENSGMQEKNMQEFAIWLKEEVLSRLEPIAPNLTGNTHD